MNNEQKKIFDDYINELIIQDKSISGPKSCLKRFFRYTNEYKIDFLKIKLHQAQDFQTYLMTLLNDNGDIYYSKGSVCMMIGSVTAFYNYLRGINLVYSNPFLEIKKVKNVQSLPRNILDEYNLDRFLRHLKTFWEGKTTTEKRQLYKAHIISELLYSTGTRINEITTAKPENIDFTRGIVKIVDSKSKRERECILNEYTLKILKIYIDEMRELVTFGQNNADTTLLFRARYNLKSWINNILNKESEKLGYGRFTSHNFRHAYGYHMLRAGCDIRFIQEMLGHKEINTTQIYTKIDKEDLRGIIDEYHPRVFNRGRVNEKV